jgi:DNA polymerase
MCRPPGNRDPLPDEIAECEPHLRAKIRLIEPKVICTLGNFATKLLTGRPDGITRVHGRPQARDVEGLPVVLYPLFHPAAALRTPAVKEELRADIHRLPELIAAQRPKQEAALAEADEDADPEPAPQLDLFA